MGDEGYFTMIVNRDGVRVVITTPWGKLFLNAVFRTKAWEARERERFLQQVHGQIRNQMN
jgi:hypothetical protein